MATPYDPTVAARRSSAQRVGAGHFGADLAILAAIGLAAFLLAQWYLPTYRAAGVIRPFFYQDQFAPAVMLTCGKGFVNADATTAPALQAFLAERVDHVSCADLPASMRLERVNGFQGFSPYLMMASAIVWRVRGISWASLDLLLATLFAVTVTGAYAALRVVSGRALSLFVTLSWAISPSHLNNLPHLRDYSKAPFFILMLVALPVVFFERRTSRLIALGTIFGMVQGFGFGMRTDVILNFIPFLVVLSVGRPEGTSRQMAAKLACACSAIVVFLLVTYPVLKTYRESGTLWHVALLGLTAPHDDNLNLKIPRPPYNFPYAHDDGFIEAVVRSNWARVHPGTGPINLGSRVYDRACFDYYAMLARTFPGDMLTRMSASALRVLNLPFWLLDGHVPIGVSNPAFVWLLERRASLMQILAGSGPVATVAVLVLVGMERLRYACVAFMLLAAWAVYPFVEFQGRHIFHLEFLVLAVVAAGCTLAWRLLSRSRHEGFTRDTAVRAVRSIAMVGGLVTAGAVTLGVARAVQVPRARALLTSYATEPIVAVPTAPRPLGDGQVRLDTSVFAPQLPKTGVQTEMIVAEFAPERCSAGFSKSASKSASRTSSIIATFRYEEADPRLALNFSRKTTVPLSSAAGQPTRVFLPVYSLSRASTVLSRFVGIELPQDIASCVQLWRFSDAMKIPLLLPATLVPAWENEKLYQRLHVDAAVPPRVWRAVVRWWPRASNWG